ncbi:MAG: hypothetical protein IT481_08405 [Gammaproteobacteria bacterium]|nr:hypothetical protein [Gammaproteobacteria bacterium]
MGLSPTKRQALWQREAMNAYLAGHGYQPICNLCGLPVITGDAWDESHDPAKPKCFGGERVGVAHRRCNREHGAQVVVPVRAKSDRVRARHTGADGPGLGRHPMRAGRRSRESKTFHHGLQRRLTLAQKLARMRAARAIVPLEDGGAP